MIPGVVVVVNFDGVTGIKRRPAVVVSTEKYNLNRGDVIVALITSQISRATDSSDHVLENWIEAGLDKPSAVRTFLQTYPISRTRAIGRISDSDWKSLLKCLRYSIEV